MSTRKTRLPLRRAAGQVGELRLDKGIMIAMRQILCQNILIDEGVELMMAENILKAALRVRQ